MLKPLSLLAIWLVLLVPFGLRAQENLHFSQTETNLADAFSQLEKAGYSLSYGNQVSLEKPLSLPKTSLSVADLLKVIEKQLELKYKVSEQKIVFYYSRDAMSKSGKVTVSGYVYQAKGKESLIGATVYDMQSDKGTVSNVYGFYSFTGAPPLKLRFSFVGMADTVVSVSTSTSLDVVLQPSDKSLTTVEVVADRAQETQMSTVSVSPDVVNKLPALLGEPDVIKSLTLMPGVSSGNDNSGGFYVRGGGPDQNLILLDGANIYNSAHAFDLFTTINTDAIKQVDLIKGGFPARYGGRLSSVMDIRLRDGNMQEFTGEVGLGYLLSSATLEGPIVKDKASFLITGRRTFTDLIFSPIIKQATKNSSEQTNQIIAFSDITAKVNWVVGPKDRLYLSGYRSGDYFKVGLVLTDEVDDNTRRQETLNAKLAWSNRVLALRWNHQFHNKLFQNTALTYSRFGIGIDLEAGTESTINGNDFASNFYQNFSSNITDYSLQTQFDYHPSPAHAIKFGAAGTFHQFAPGLASFKQESNTSNDVDTAFGNRMMHSFESSLFVEDEITLGHRTKANVGVHVSSLLVNDELYPSLQPRLSLKHELATWWNLTASYARMAQFIHLLTNSTLGIPLDLWVPATPQAPPMQSQQVALGTSWHTNTKSFEFSIEGYYKEMDGLITYKEGANFTDVQEAWEDKILIDGSGEAYGLEFFVRKNSGKTTGWLGYTISKTNRQFAGINNAEPFPYKYDRRHDASVVVMHEFNERVNLSTSWVYATGNSLTFPAGTFQGLNALPNLEPTYVTYQNGADMLDYNGRNSIRLPSYHRLDIGINFSKEKKRGTRTWNFSIYNAYVQKNPFLVFLTSEQGYNNSLASFTQSNERNLRQVSAFWFVPSGTYTFKFN